MWMSAFDTAADGPARVRFGKLLRLRMDDAGHEQEGAHHADASMPAGHDRAALDPAPPAARRAATSRRAQAVRNDSAGFMG